MCIRRQCRSGCRQQGVLQLPHVYSCREAADATAGEPATTNIGAKVTVAGAIKLTDIGKMYLKSHPVTGVSPVLSAASASVDATSFIDANNAGFFGNNTSTYNNKCTPGQAPTNPTGKHGAGHGGQGGWGEQSSTSHGAGTYDATDWPVLCGGGANCNYQGNWPNLGGGVLRLFVTGDIVVNGYLRANANSPGNFSGAGAGGTVLLSCRTITGSGNIQAKGSDGYQYTASSSGHNGGAGGGGRIATHYDATEQAKVSCGVIYNAAGGVGVQNGTITGSGDPGTVWFTDETIVNEGNTHSGTLYVPDLLNFVKRDSLTVENAVTSLQPGGYVEIKNDLVIKGASSGVSGFEVPEGYFKVGGNLIIDGGHVTVSGSTVKNRASIFEVGGVIAATNAIITITDSEEYPTEDLFKVAGAVELDASSVTVTYAETNCLQTLTVAEHLFMTNGSTFSVQSPINPVEGEPGVTFMTPELTLCKNCWIYPYCHATNGAAVLFKIPRILCTANAGFNANEKGYKGLASPSVYYGPMTTALDGRGYHAWSGANAYGTYAAGHGGNGGNYIAVSATYPRGKGLAFDNYRRPVFAGPAGAGSYNSSCTPARGGGVVRIEADYFDLGGGTLTANGGTVSNFRTGSAGGSIYVKTDRFLGGGGSLSANGGDGSYYGFSEQIGNHKNYCMAGGGGGCIAVHYNTSPSLATNVTVSVAGGNCPLDLATCLDKYSEDLTELKATRTGAAGTVYLHRHAGMCIILR